MKIRNSKFDLTGDSNETITVAVDSPTGEVINYVLNGKPWGGGSFVLDKTVTSIFKLSMTVTYKATAGGSATMTITGSNGGDVSRNKEQQAPEELFDVAIYRFTIV
jgi:hypothetical protein